MPVKDCDCILLVEDNPDDVTLAQRALRKNNIANDVKVLSVIADNGQPSTEIITQP